MGNRVFFTRHW